MKSQQFPMKWSAIITGGIFGLIAGLGVVANWWQPFSSQAVNHLVGIVSGLISGSLIGFLAYDWKEVYRAIPKAFRACLFGFGAILGAFNLLFVMLPKMIWQEFRVKIFFAIVWSLPYSIFLGYWIFNMKTAEAGLADAIARYVYTGLFFSMPFLIAIMLADLICDKKIRMIPAEEYQRNQIEFQKQFLMEATKKYLIFYPKSIYYLFYVAIGLLVFLALFPFKFIYSLVYHTWSAPRLFHAVFSALCVAIGYPVGVVLGAVLPAIGIGVAIGLIAAKITHRYLSVRETALRPVSWHPFRIFANGQVG